MVDLQKKTFPKLSQSFCLLPGSLIFKISKLHPAMCIGKSGVLQSVCFSSTMAVSLVRGCLFARSSAALHPQGAPRVRANYLSVK